MITEELKEIYKNMPICMLIKQNIKLKEYFIFAYRVEKTKHIEHYLLQNKEESILNMFNQRELEENYKYNN